MNGTARVTACIALLSLAMGAARAQERMNGPFGGDGGHRFVQRCPAGTRLTGVSARYGAYFNNIAAVCEGRVQPGAGGNDGARRKVLCPEGSVVHEIGAQFLRSDNRLLKTIVLYCVRRINGKPAGAVRIDTPGAFTRPAGGGSTYPWKNFSCLNQAAVGLHGRAGAAVDAIGLICNGPAVG